LLSSLTPFRQDEAHDPAKRERRILRIGRVLIDLALVS
jgi:hypothetical protein